MGQCTDSTAVGLCYTASCHNWMLRWQPASEIVWQVGMSGMSWESVGICRQGSWELCRRSPLVVMERDTYHGHGGFVPSISFIGHDVVRESGMWRDVFYEHSVSNSIWPSGAAKLSFNWFEHGDGHVPLTLSAMLFSCRVQGFIFSCRILISFR